MSKMIFELLLVVVSALLIYLYILHFNPKKPKGFPPGPFSWPIFGNLLQIGTKPHKAVMKMRQKYGDIIGIDLGSRRAVFVNEYNIFKEAYTFPAFSGRCTMPHFAEQDTGIFRGVAFTSGQTWAEQRRFTFSYIQSGLRKEYNMESLVMKEISVLIKDLKNTSGTPISTRYAFNISSINSLWKIVAGKRYSLDDQSFMKMVQHVSALISSPLIQGLLVFYPKFSKLFPRLSGYQMVQENVSAILEFMQCIVDEHKATYTEGIIRDFVDYYLQKIKTTTDQNSSFFKETGEKHLIHCLFDMFFAGTDTVSTTLHWHIFLMAHFPEVQSKLINEILGKLKLGHQKSISLENRASLPYVEAVIQEVMRFSALLPLNVFRECTEDVDFYGYKIPQGTVIVANQYGILHDPDIWGDPENFRPERFLTEDCMEVIRHPALVPFGFGHRICPGEKFAKDELFLFVTSISQNFRVEFNPSIPVPPVKHVVANILLPMDHQIVFHKHCESK